MRDTCDYPTTSNAYFTRVSEPKLSDDMKGENFFFNFFCILGTKNTPTNLSIVDVFNVSILYYEKSIDTFSLCIIHEWICGVNNFFKIFFTQIY